MRYAMAQSRWADSGGEGGTEMWTTGLMDAWAVYAKFMSAWMESTRRGVFPQDWATRPAEPREEIFALMWRAYEEWIGRGVNQYWQVAVELERFYSYIRRNTMAQPGSTDEDIAHIA